MKLNETTLSFLEVDCIQQFGKEKGKFPRPVAFCRRIRYTEPIDFTGCTAAV